MGYIKHNAIVVTCWDFDGFNHAVSYAKSTGAIVLHIDDEAVNGYMTFIVCPDGSKEGWGASDAGDDRREAIKQWLRKQAYEDGSSMFEWAEIAYGSDDGKAEIVDSQWEAK